MELSFLATYYCIHFMVFMEPKEFDANSMINDWRDGDRTGTVNRFKNLPDSHKFYFTLTFKEVFSTEDLLAFYNMLKLSELMGAGGIRNRVPKYIDGL